MSVSTLINENKNIHITKQRPAIGIGGYTFLNQYDVGHFSSFVTGYQ